MKKWARSLGWQRWAAVACIGVGLSITIFLGVWAVRDSPPNGPQSALLVLLAGLFQVAGTGVFGRVGRADANLARTAVRKLVGMAKRAAAAEQLAQATFESNANAQTMRGALGQLSVHFSYIQEGLINAADEWRDIHALAVGDIFGGNDDE